MSTFWATLKHYALILLGAFLVAIAVDLFLAPNHLAFGGVSGLATALNHIIPVSIGALAILLNIPLFWAGFRQEGKLFGINSIIGTIALSVFIDLLSVFPPVTDDLLLAALFGGLIAGIGLGLVFLQGATTGGTDIMARLVRRVARHMQIGNLMFAVDIVIIAIAVVIFRDIKVGLYSAIALYASTWMIDTMVEGVGFAKLVYIISNSSQEIATAINTTLNRGATALPGRGTYSNHDRIVLLCTVKRHEIPKVKDIVLQYDKNAFVIVSDAREVLGEGFRAM